MLDVALRTVLPFLAWETMKFLTKVTFKLFSEDRIIAICEEMEKRVEEATRAGTLLNVCESVIRGTRNSLQYECALEEIEKNSWQSPPELLNNILNSFE